MYHRDMVSVGAVGAAAPTDSQKDFFAPSDFDEGLLFVLDFHMFHPKVTLLSVFLEHFENLYPQL